MIVFDAGVLIATFDSDDAHHAAARELLEELEDFEFAMSAVTLAETLVRPVADDTAAALTADLDRLHMLRLGLDGSDALGLAAVRHQTRLRMPDAIVLYTAEREGAELATTDAAVARAAESRGLVAHLVG